MKSWKRLPALNFMVLNFVVRLIANDVMWNVNFELGIHGAYFLLRWGTLQCWVLCEKLVSQTRPKQTQCRSLTKDYLHYGIWLVQACETTRQPTTPTKTFHLAGPVLENSYYASVRITIVLIRMLLWLSRAYFRLYRVEREVLAPFSVGHASAFSVNFLSYHMQDSLR